MEVEEKWSKILEETPISPLDLAITELVNKIMGTVNVEQLKEGMLDTFKRIINPHNVKSDSISMAVNIVLLEYLGVNLKKGVVKNGNL